MTRISPVSSGHASTTSRRSVGTAPVQATLGLYESRQVALGVLVQPVGRQAIAQRRGHGILLRTSLRRFVPFGSARNAAVERPHKSPPGAAVS